MKSCCGCCDCDCHRDRAEKNRFSDLSRGDVFKLIDGLPANEKYPRVYYIKCDYDTYTQLTGPSAGKIYHDGHKRGPVAVVNLSVHDVDGYAW